MLLLLPRLVLAADAQAEKETGDAWADLGNWKKAVGHYQKAVELDPKLSEARMRLANGLYRIGDRKAALTHLEQLARQDPKSAAVAAATGVIWLESDQPAKACRWFSKALAAEPNNARSLYGTGQCHHVQFDKSRKEQDKQAALKGYQAYLDHYAQGPFAEPARQAADQLRLGEAGVALEAAREAITAGKFRVALETLTKLVAKKPDLEQAQYLLGLTMASPVVDDLDGAIAAWRKAPGVKEARLQLGVVAYEDDDAAQAIEQLERAVALDPRYVEAWYQLGLVSIQLIDERDREGNLARARRAFEQVKALAPKSKLAEQAASKLQLLTGQVQFLSESEVIDTASEVELGRKVIAQIEQRFGVANDERLQARLNEILRKISNNSERLAGSMPYKVKVLKVDGINALSFTGGTIYLYQGLLDFVRTELDDSDDALAAVIAHEVVHVDRRHGLGMLDLVGGARSLMSGASFNVRSLNTLMKGISRRHEYEADQIGALYAYRAGFNPAAAYRFHRRMIATGHEVADDQDHPTHLDRSARLKEYLLSVRAKARHFDKGLGYLDDGEYGDAIRHFEIFLGVFPSNLPARNNLGVALQRQAMAKRVGEHGYKLSTEIDPRSRIRDIVVRAADDKPVFSPDEALIIEAAVQFQAVLEQEPDYQMARTNLGACWLAMGKQAQAVREFERVLAAGQASPEARNNLAVAQLVAGETASGTEILVKLIDQNPTYADAYYNLARVRQAAGDLDSTRKLYLAYLARDKSSGWAEQARQALAELAQAQPKP
jgi:predicted Zn-dependent protease